MKETVTNINHLLFGRGTAVDYFSVWVRDSKTSITEECRQFYNKPLLFTSNHLLYPNHQHLKAISGFSLTSCVIFPCRLLSWPWCSALAAFSSCSFWATSCCCCSSEHAARSFSSASWVCNSSRLLVKGEGGGDQSLTKWTSGIHTNCGFIVEDRFKQF